MMPLESLAGIGIFTVGAAAGSLITWIRFTSVIGKCRQEVAESGKALQAALVQASEPHSRLGMKALVLSNDSEVFRLLSPLFNEINLDVEKCSIESAVIERLSSEKFDALVVDLDLPWAGTILLALGDTRPNANVPLFAVLGANQHGNECNPLGISGVTFIERPLETSKVRESLRNAYGRMIRERQAYFRLAIKLPVSIRRSTGNLLQCTTINLSQNGMAIQTSVPFSIGEPLYLLFAIPNTDISVCAEGAVIWDDKHGKTGVRFECTTASVKTRFIDWLHDQFFIQDAAGQTNGKITRPSDGVAFQSEIAYVQ